MCHNYLFITLNWLTHQLASIRKVAPTVIISLWKYIPQNVWGVEYNPILPFISRKGCESTLDFSGDLRRWSHVVYLFLDDAKMIASNYV